MPSPSPINISVATDPRPVSLILTQAAAWMESVPPYKSLWLSEDLTAETLADEVAQGHYYLLSDLATDKNRDPREQETVKEPAAIGTFRLTSEDSVFWRNEPGRALYLHRIARSRQHARKAGGVSLVSEILAFAEHQAQRASVDWLRLDCDRTRHQLCELYEGFGFKYHSNFDLPNYTGVRYQRQVPT